jgi:hypothetical protein
MPDILSEFGVILHRCDPSAQPADFMSDILTTAGGLHESTKITLSTFMCCR